MLALSFTVTEDITHRKSGRRHYAKGQRVYVRALHNDGWYNVTGPCMGRTEGKWVTRRVPPDLLSNGVRVDVPRSFMRLHRLAPARHIGHASDRAQGERRELDLAGPLHHAVVGELDDVPLLMLLGA